MQNVLCASIQRRIVYYYVILNEQTHTRMLYTNKQRVSFDDDSVELILARSTVSDDTMHSARASAEN